VAEAPGCFCSEIHSRLAICCLPRVLPQFPSLTLRFPLVLPNRNAYKGALLFVSWKTRPPCCRRCVNIPYPATSLWFKIALVCGGRGGSWHRTQYQKLRQTHSRRPARQNRSLFFLCAQHSALEGSLMKSLLPRESAAVATVLPKTEALRAGA